MDREEFLEQVDNFDVVIWKTTRADDVGAYQVHDDDRCLGYFINHADACEFCVTYALSWIDGVYEEEVMEL